MLVRGSGVTWEVVAGQVILLNPAATRLVTLNELGSRVWEALDGHDDVESLARAVAPLAAEVPLGRLTADVAEFVEDLRRAGLVD